MGYYFRLYMGQFTHHRINRSLVLFATSAEKVEKNKRKKTNKNQYSAISAIQCKKRILTYASGSLSNGRKSGLKNL